jgi:hypothetical protein
MTLTDEDLEPLLKALRSVRNETMAARLDGLRALLQGERALFDAVARIADLSLAAANQLTDPSLVAELREELTEARRLDAGIGDLLATEPCMTS